MKYLFVAGLLLSILLSYAISTQAQITDFPWVESFDASIISSEWSQEYISGEALWTTQQGGLFNNPPLAHSGTLNAFFSSANYNDDETILISPEFDFSNLENPRLSFYHAQYNWDSDQDQLKILYKVGVDGEWITLASYTGAINAWTLRNIEIPSNEASVYIGFKALSGYGYGVVVDEVVVDDAPDCPVPEDFIVTNTSTESATVTWSSEAVVWQLEYGLEGFTQGEGTLINNVVNHQYIITGLEENTSYDCYIRSQCTGNNSIWVGPINFTTNCYPLQVNNYFEGFEGEAIPPSCWEIIYNNPNPNLANLATLSTSVAFEGNQSFRFSSYAPGPPYEQYLISPQIQNYIGVRELRFWYKRYNSGSETFRVGYSTSGTNLTTDFDWTPAITNASPEWQLFSIELPEGVKYITIHYMTVFQYYLYIDNLQIRIPPTCPQPENFNVNNVTAVSAQTTWVPVGDELEWTISYGPAGFLPIEGTTINTENPVYVINNLTPNTSYEAYVRSNCSEENSVWTGPISFSTPYGCEQIINIFCNTITAETANIQWTPSGDEIAWNIEYGPSGFIPGTGTLIENLTNPEYLIENILSNTSYDVYVQAYCGNQFGTSTWSDEFTFTTLPCDNGCMYELQMTDSWGDGWGNNYVQIFQDGELTSTHALIGGSLETENIYLCEGALVELKIQPTTYAGEIGMTLSNPFGVILYTLEQGTLSNSGSIQTLTSFTATCVAPDCYPPTDVYIDNITFNGAVVHFTPADDALSYDISYGIEETAPDEGVIFSEVPPSFYTLDDLLANTTYDVYIRTNCSLSESTWVGPFSFTTSSVQLNNPSLCETSIAIPDNDCIMVSVEVSDVPYSALGMDVVLDEVRLIIDHEFDDDIDLYLISPSGTQTLLFSDIGDNNTGFGIINGNCDQYTTLNMYGVDGIINSGVAPFTGSYIPEGNFNNLYDGTNPNGYWTLQVCDDANFFIGSLEYIELVFAPQKYLMWSDNIFIEAPANDGSIGTTIELELYNETFANTGVLINGTDFQTSGIPEGIEIVINALTPNMANISFTGNALQHANINDVNDLSIHFNNSAFSGNNAAEILNAEKDGLIIDFKNLTDISNTSPIPELAYVCVEDLNNQIIEYTFVNTGENPIPAGSVIEIKGEYPIGTIALQESLQLTSELLVGAEISGNTASSIYFGDVGTHEFRIIIQAPSDILPNNDTLNGIIVGVSQEIEFIGTENDTLVVSEYPAIVAAHLNINPDSSLNISYYWEDGISTSNSIDVVTDGWYSCIITTEACAIVDSVFVYIPTSIYSNQSPEPQLTLYPNPASDIIYLKFEQIPEEDVNLKIYSLNGQLVHENRAYKVDPENPIAIDIAWLTKGMYIIETSTKQKHWVQKLIIND
jgi:subtilisin-like proprotein convertase family protein